MQLESRCSLLQCYVSEAARFDDSTAKERAVFQATVFEGDVSFIDFRADRVDYLNTLFKGDAEFRYCVLESARFSSREHMSVFYGLADFRGCEMESASFAFVEARGPVSFVKARFGEGGLSLANASFAGPLTNLDGLTSEGPLDLSDAYLPTLRFRWSDIDEAVLAAGPGAGVIEELSGRLERLGRNREALAMEYDLAKLTGREISQDSSRDILERAAARLEWLLWGWPTGYGTELGRIVLITVASWLLLSLPLLVRQGLIANTFVRRSKGERKSEKSSRYTPSYWYELPPGSCSPLALRHRLGAAWAYTFGLMFKLGAKDLSYVELEHRPGKHGFERYFLFLWIFGSVLLALMALTLSNSSPVFNKILGEVLL